VNQIQARDAEVYRKWVDGMTQRQIATQYGVTRGAIGKAVARHAAQLPPQDKAAEVRKVLDMIEELEAVFLPRALAGSISAVREVRGLELLKGRYLGIDRREVHVQGEVHHQVQYEPGPTLDQVIDRMREQGMIRGEITRP
jgi:hypothetical protein